jgi:hypothetical protein
MNEKELDCLIEKYYNGNSTEEEERDLRAYFRKNDIPEGYNAEKAVFCYYTASEEVPEPSEGFEARIISGIDKSVTKSRSSKFKYYIIPYLSVAAGLLILAGSWFFFIQRTEPRDTFKDPAIAYAETMKILYSVSERLNKGVTALEPVSKMNEVTQIGMKAINESTVKIEKNINYITKSVENADVLLKNNRNN